MNGFEMFFYWMQGFVDAGGVTGPEAKKILYKMEEFRMGAFFEHGDYSPELQNKKDPLTDEQINDLHPDIADAVGLSGTEKLPDDFLDHLEEMPEDLKPVGFGIEQTTTGNEARDLTEIPQEMLVEHEEETARQLIESDDITHLLK